MGKEKADDATAVPPPAAKVAKTEPAASKSDGATLTVGGFPYHIAATAVSSDMVALGAHEAFRPGLYPKALAICQGDFNRSYEQVVCLGFFVALFRS